MTFYHITTEENAEKILKNGLLPQIGPRSKTVQEPEKLIYLAKRHDVPYWQILLNMPVMLSVKNLTEEQTQKWRYSAYDEYTYNQLIPAERIAVTDFKISLKERRKAMRCLCLDHLCTISRFTEYCARYNYHDNDNPDEKERIEHTGKILFTNSEHLDFSILQTHEIYDFLLERGEDGAYTFCDIYFEEETTLLEQLLKYPEDDLTPLRQKVYEYTTSILNKRCLHVPTGGWCGC